MSLNFLIVDDSPLTRKMVKRTINMANLDVGNMFEAGNGKEALEVLKNQWVDIVFADINMPEMSGIELVERMAKDNMLASVPVVIISTERGEERIAHLKALGVSGYLNKPFTPEVILETVSGLLPSVKEKG